MATELKLGPLGAIPEITRVKIQFDIYLCQRVYCYQNAV